MFVGSALDDLRDFPLPARRDAGHQIDQVQRGLAPDDWKPMRTVGVGVREIRLRDASGAFRIVYVATFADAVYVLQLLPEAIGTYEQNRYRPGRPALSHADDGVETMTNERYTNVWDAIEGQPAEAENMKLRSELMIALKQRIAQLELNQAQAAQRLGVTQPRVSDLLRGKINLFGLDALVNMAAAVGLRVDLQVRASA